MTREQFVTEARALADYVESLPPLDEKHLAAAISLALFFDEPDQFAAAVRTLGNTTKDAFGEHFMARKDIGDEACVRLFVDRRAVCTKKVTQKIIPAQPERVLPAEPERVEEIVEWDCPPSILRPREPELSGVIGAEDDKFAQT